MCSKIALLWRKCIAQWRYFFNPNVRRGRRGERCAARFLKHQGYVILDRNWRCGRYELDIVAKYATCVVFVEVRGRLSSSLQSGIDTVDKKKKQAILKAIDAYRRQHKGINTFRFDVISIDWDAHGKIQNLNHYENVPLRFYRGVL